MRINPDKIKVVIAKLENGLFRAIVETGEDVLYAEAETELQAMFYLGLGIGEGGYFDDLLDMELEN
jgi:hypothetical protein